MSAGAAVGGSPPASDRRHAHRLQAALNLGWTMAELRGRLRYGHRIPPGSVGYRFPRGDHALPLGDEHTLREQRIACRVAVTLLISQCEIAESILGSGKPSDWLRQLAIDLDSAVSESEKRGAPRVEVDDHPDLVVRQAWGKVAEEIYGCDEAIQDRLGVSAELLAAYQLGRGLSECYWALDPDLRAPLAGERAGPQHWEFLLGEHRLGLLNGYLALLERALPSLTVPAISGALKNWSKIIADGSVRSFDDAAPRLLAQLQIWRDVLLGARNPASLAKKFGLLVGLRQLKRVVVDTFALESLLAICSVAALALAGYWIGANQKTSGGSIAVTILGFFGVTAAGLLARAKSQAGVVLDRLHNAFLADIVADQATALPQEKKPMPDSPLNEIKHIVVLMLENRSFDHMLGYLSREGQRTDIDGLPALEVELAPPFINLHGGAPFPIHHLDRTAFVAVEDPDHSGAATAKQIADGKMNGFVDSFAAKLAERQASDHDPGLVMGYYNADDLPVYDHLAREFLVCDNWHSSVPGATWPNRLYSIAGRADGSRDDKPNGEAPLYDLPSFVRHLDAHKVSWRWYSYDPGTLRCVDKHYWLERHENFAFVDKTKLSWKTDVKELPFIDEHSASFIEDARRGNLPDVSWIDPNFKDFNLYGGDSNDDHPPSDVHDGQLLVLSVYHALASSPQWPETMLIITYDEHGGFFDHVNPPPADDDDPKLFGQYGIRVPAIVVSPWVRRGDASHTLFDHTSIIKTILLRFCGQAELEEHKGPSGLLAWLDAGHPHYMGKRTAAANDLGSLLTERTPRSAPDRDALVEQATARKAEQLREAFANPPTDAPPPLNDLQVGIALAARQMRQAGLPPIQP